MPLTAAIGQSNELDGKDAAIGAVRQALNRLSGGTVAFGFVVASFNYNFERVLNGVISLLGNTPVIGMSTTAGISNAGLSERGVLVGLVAGTGFSARIGWFPGYGDDPRVSMKKLVKEFGITRDSRGVLLAACDGLAGDATGLTADLPLGKYAVAGGLAAGDFYRGRTYQLAGNQSGSGGLGAAWLTGRIGAALGLAHGWTPVGAVFEITHSRGLWVRTIDNKPAADVYANLLGYESRDWLYPPLNQLVRLYPMGIEQPRESGFLIRAPLRMEADGSLRMNTRVPEGQISHLLIGSQPACLQAARQAAQQALQNAGGAKPVLGLIFVDQAWQMLMESDPGMEIREITQALGGQVPIIGGYTLGQLASTAGSVQAALLNQHILLLLLTEPVEG